jgi:hypothetical protein
MPMRSLVVFASLALAVAAGAQAASQRGTLTGIVTRGPITPVCAFEQPCDEPAPHQALLFVRNGAPVARVLTDATGHYRLRLAVGVYAVRRPSAATIDRKIAPNRVRVIAGRTVRIDFSIDTGIR